MTEKGYNLIYTFYTDANLSIMKLKLKNLSIKFNKAVESLINYIIYLLSDPIILTKQ